MQSIDLAPDEKECLLQLFIAGPTWDGDLVSKAGRTGLVERGYAERCNGWQQLTSAGFQVAVGAGFGDEKERRDNRRRRDSAARDTALALLVDKVGGSFVIVPDSHRFGLDVSRGKDGSVRFAVTDPEY